MKKFLLFFALCFGIVTVQAQYKGRIIDQKGAPVALASVVALSLPDSAVVTGVMTEGDGCFELSAQGRGGLLRVSLVGYETLFLPLEKGRTVLGDITLTNSGHLLNEAMVTAARPVARLTAAGLETEVAGTALENAGTAEDLLQKVPGLVKKDDKIEVLGKGAPVIYINGRQVRDANELVQLRSDEIKSVEVIRNPGARYDASVGSVVRIRTKKRQGEGFGADATAVFSQGKNGSGNGQLALNYRKDGLDVFASAYYRHRRYYGRQQSDQITYADTLWTLPFSSNTQNQQRSLNTTAGFNYELSENHSFGLRYQLFNVMKDETAGRINSDIKADGVYYDRLENFITAHADSDPQHQVNAYYTGKLGRGEFSADVDFYADGSSDDQQTAENSAEHDDRLVHSLNNVRNRLVAGKAQYQLPIWGGRLTVGGQYTFTNRHDDYLVPVNDWGVNTARSQLKEQNAAGFAEYARQVKGLGQVSAGLRYENVRFDYFENHVRSNDQSRVFSNLFPSLSLATAIGRVQIMAAYTAKTRRPEYMQLSNNVTYGNRFLLQGGNPTLRPTVTHDVTLTGVWKFLQGVLTFRQEKDAIIFWGTSLPERPSTTKISHINKSFPTLQAMLTAAPKIGLWHPNFTAVIVQSRLEMPFWGSMRKFDNPMFVGAWNNAFTLPGGLVFNADYRFQSRGEYQNVCISNVVHWLDVSLSKTFMKDALTVTLRGQDLLHSNQTVNILMERSRFVQKSESDSRRFEVTLRYRFNTVRSKYKGQGAAGDELKRL